MQRVQEIINYCYVSRMEKQELPLQYLNTCFSSMYDLGSFLLLRSFQSSEEMQVLEVGPPLTWESL